MCAFTVKYLHNTILNERHSDILCCLWDERDFQVYRVSARHALIVVHHRQSALNQNEWLGSQQAVLSWLHSNTVLYCYNELQHVQLPHTLCMRHTNGPSLHMCARVFVCVSSQYVNCLYVCLHCVFCHT